MQQKKTFHTGKISKMLFYNTNVTFWQNSCSENDLAEYNERAKLCVAKWKTSIWRKTQIHTYIIYSNTKTKCICMFRSILLGTTTLESNSSQVF